MRVEPITEFRDEWWFLSNFYPYGFMYLSYPFPTAEHAFQAQKVYYCHPMSEQETFKMFTLIRTAPTPNIAKRYGRQLDLDVERWNESRVGIMRDIIHDKFRMPPMRKLLDSTGAAMLIEGNTWGDTFWGRCGDKGLNLLGVILMEERGNR